MHDKMQLKQHFFFVNSDLLEQKKHFNRKAQSGEACFYVVFNELNTKLKIYEP